VAVNNDVTNTPTQTQATAPSPTDQGEVKGEVESVQGQGGSQGGGGGGGEGVAGQEFAQTDTGEESGSGQTAGNQPAELASTGVNIGALLLIGAVCVAGSLLLFRRRRTA
jgi:LPXTG-motif cell wall-anchored protein